MMQPSLKASIFNSLGVLIVVLLFLNLFYVVYRLHYSDVTCEQSLLARRILFCALRPPRVEKVEPRQPFADNSEKCGDCKAGPLPEIDLLLKGGLLNGKHLSRIKNAEIAALLQSLRAHWCEVMRPPQPGASGLKDFCRQARTLNDALMQRALVARTRLKAPVWSVLLLACLILVWLSLRHYFDCKNQSPPIADSDGPQSGPENRSEAPLDITQEQLRELSEKLFRVQDDERQQLADELHDGLCQSLAALKMQVFRVEKGIDDEVNRDDCRKARQFIAQIIEDVRRLSHDLSPVILEDLGLGGALAHLANNFAALNDLKVSISVPDLEGCFSDEAARHVYRIVQEALNNVAKHAQASLLLLEAEVADDSVCFRIRDDGVGFSSDYADGSERNAAGLGLTSMVQRVRLLGGEFSLSTKPGAGCTVTFTVPGKTQV